MMTDYPERRETQATFGIAKDSTGVVYVVDQEIIDPEVQFQRSFLGKWGSFGAADRTILPCHGIA